MPLSTVRFAPGQNAEITQAQGMAQITSTQLVRFKYAGPEILVEKLGGWDKYYPLALGSPVRDLHAWEGINSDTHLAAGCTGSLNVISDGVGEDITPRTETTNPTVDFTTTNGISTVTIKDDGGIVPSIYMSIFLQTPVSVGGIVLYGSYQIATVLGADEYTIEAASDATASVANGGAVPEFNTTLDDSAITVTLEDHGYVVGQVFPIAVSTTVGGLTLFGSYIVQSVTDADNFVINAVNTASSTASAFENGGDARITYYIGLGPLPTSAGYGTGTYGSGGYGTGSVIPGSTGTPITATNWTLDNWGSVLIACPAGGAIYEWTPNSAVSNALKIVGAPSVNGGIFVSQTAQVLIAWASSSADGAADPLNVNWSTVGDYTIWAVNSQTQAGGYRIPTGSRIVGGMAGPIYNLIWTDVDLWSMDYVGLPEVYGFNSLGSNCGLAAVHAAVTLNSIVYWVGSNKQFYTLNGGTVQVLPCTVWDFIFQDLDTDNIDKVCAGTNSLFNEVAFYFPSASGGTGEVDSYVKYNTVTETWDSGRLSRTAWIDQSPIGNPVGGSPEGYIYQHETSPNADGQPLLASFSTGYFAIADGENLNFVDWILPDFRYGYISGEQSANLGITVFFADYPTEDTKSVGPYNVTVSTKWVNTRLRARFMGITVESSDLDSFWRLGGLKFRTTPDGKR